MTEFMTTTAFVCQRCGRGWLRYPGRICPEAMWTVIVGGERTDGEDCFGQIRPLSLPSTDAKDVNDGLTDTPPA